MITVKRLKNKVYNQRQRGGFTLVEVLVAGVITAFIIGSISTTVGRLSRAKNTSQDRLTAHLRADAALNAIRTDLISVMRDTDLFYTRFKIDDDVRSTPIGVMDRDEVLVFATRLQAVRNLSFQGEGIEYETQYRVEDDDQGPVLWQRRDSVPDEYTIGGGQATPAVEGIIGLSIEAYDGLDWREIWDSDSDGLPLAVRITVTASGHHNDEDLASASIATLRTIVPFDRLVPPMDWLLPSAEEELELEEYLVQLLANFGQQGQNQDDSNPGIDSGGELGDFGAGLIDGAGQITEISGLEAAGIMSQNQSGGRGGASGGLAGGGGTGSGTTGGAPPRPSGVGPVNGVGGRTGSSSGSSGNSGVDE